MFDFATKAVLQEAVGKCQYWRLADVDGKPPGLVGWWPTRSVTFVDNHDTGVRGRLTDSHHHFHMVYRYTKTRRLM